MVILHQHRDVFETDFLGKEGSWSSGWTGLVWSTKAVLTLLHHGISLPPCWRVWESEGRADTESCVKHVDPDI